MEFICIKLNAIYAILTPYHFHNIGGGSVINHSQSVIRAARPATDLVVIIAIGAIDTLYIFVQSVCVNLSRHIILLSSVLKRPL
jgi:hypothetical protein